MGYLDSVNGLGNNNNNLNLTPTPPQPPGSQQSPQLLLQDIVALTQQTGGVQNQAQQSLLELAESALSADLGGQQGQQGTNDPLEQMMQAIYGNTGGQQESEFGNLSQIINNTNWQSGANLDAPSTSTFSPSTFSPSTSSLPQYGGGQFNNQYGGVGDISGPNRDYQNLIPINPLPINPQSPLTPQQPTITADNGALIPQQAGTSNPNGNQFDVNSANESGFAPNETLAGTVHSSDGHPYTIGRLQNGDYTIHDNYDGGKQIRDLGTNPTLTSLQGSLSGTGLNPEAVLDATGNTAAASTESQNTQIGVVKQGSSAITNLQNGDSVGLNNGTTWTHTPGSNPSGQELRGTNDGQISIGTINGSQWGNASWNDSPSWLQPGSAPPTSDQVNQEVQNIQQQEPQLDPSTIRTFLANEYLNSNFNSGLNQQSIQGPLAQAFGVNGNDLYQTFQDRGGKN